MGRRVKEGRKVGDEAMKAFSTTGLMTRKRLFWISDSPCLALMLLLMLISSEWHRDLMYFVQRLLRLDATRSEQQPSIL